MKENKTKIILSVLVLAGLVGLAMIAGAGNLEPNAPPGPTMHTLEDIYNLVGSGIEPPPQTFAFDCFLKIDGIPGESLDDKHKDWIEVLSYSHDVSIPVFSSAFGEGHVTGDSEHDAFTIVKELDKSSPKLAEALCTGKHIPNIRLELCRAGGDKEKFMEYKMQDVIVSGYETIMPAHVQGQSTLEHKHIIIVGISGGETLPMEEVSFNYRQFMWEYTTADGNSIRACWDLDSNSPVCPVEPN
jgi:type VI secretion system secreted protein Hcp